MKRLILLCIILALVVYFYKDGRTFAENAHSAFEDTISFFKGLF